MSYSEIAIDVTAKDLEDSVKTSRFTIEKLTVENQLSTAGGSNSIVIDSDLFCNGIKYIAEQKQITDSEADSYYCIKFNLVGATKIAGNYWRCKLDVVKLTDNVEMDTVLDTLNYVIGTFETDENGYYKANSLKIYPENYLDNKQDQLTDDNLGFGLTVDENGFPKVDTTVIPTKEDYDTKADKSEVSNAVKGTASGTAILIEDVSPITHKVKVSGESGTNVKVYGKNLIYIGDIPETTKNGVTYHSNPDGSITLNGTSTSSFTIKFIDDRNKITLTKGTYIGSFGGSADYSKYNLGWQATGTNKALIDGGRRRELQISEDTTMGCAYIYIYNNRTFDNETIYPIAISSTLNENYYLDFEKFKEPTDVILDDNGKGELDSKSPNMTILSSSDVNVEYNKNITSISKLKGIKCMFFGDSITASIERYRGYLLKNTKMHEVKSFAVSGATWRNSTNTEMDGNPTSSSNNTIPNQVQKLLNSSADYEEPDIILFFGGTNDDYIDNTEEESQFTKNSDYKTYIDVNSCDLTSFAGAMRWCVEKVQTLYPNAKIIFITNLQAALRYYNQQKSKRNKTISICERMSITVFDAFAESGIYSRFEKENANGKYLRDGLHPNNDGAKLIARYIQKKLEKEV